MAPIFELFSQGKISSAEFASLYVIAILSHRFPGEWLGAKRDVLVSTHSLKLKLTELPWSFEPNILRRLSECETVGDAFNRFAFKSTPEAVHRALLLWSTGAYPLELMFHIPSPEIVLDQQVRGHRCVTALLKKKEMERFVLGERDVLSFTMHDLIHADHFYKDNHCYEGQLSFYHFLSHVMKNGAFSELLLNPEFEREFEYLIADMNAYAIHLLKCLKSAVIHYHPRKVEFFQEWSQRLTDDEKVRKAFERLNEADYHPETQDSVILEFLSSFRNRHFP